MEQVMDHAYGCLLGLLCGDAAGATLEFFRKPITEKIVEDAMKMPGGGQLCVGPGQVTDDSELAMSLAYALYDKHPQNGFPIEAVSSSYSEWYNSRPFDIGSTCCRAFSITPDNDNKFANKMMKQANEASFVSEANGALMRVAPIALWSLTTPQQTLIHNAKLDAMLSHPNQVCQDCNAILCIAIAHLIKNPGDNMGALGTVEDYVNTHAHPKVREWFLKDSLNIDNMVCTSNIGHVRWAFTLAMHFLRNPTSYETAIKQTLLKGGDTDTNAAIVGCLMGALHGADKIPDYMKNPVRAFNVEKPKNGYARPSKYNASNMYDITYYLLTHLPVQSRKP